MVTRPRSASVQAMRGYMPPNGLRTVSLLVTDVTFGTPFAISATLMICVASGTVPFSVTAPSFAVTLILPALISLCFPMAAYTLRRSTRSAFLPFPGAVAPDASVADPAAALAGALAAELFCDQAFIDSATIIVPIASARAEIVCKEVSVVLAGKRIRSRIFESQRAAVANSL